MIYVERDKPTAADEVASKLQILQEAVSTNSNHVVKEALLQVIPTYHLPEEVNARAAEAEEMKASRR